MVLKGGVMIVKNIVKNAAMFLNLNDLLETTLLGGSKTADDVQTEEINFLVACCNLACNQVASEYITLTDTKSLTSTTGMISYPSISSKTIVDILKVKQNGVEVEFSCKPNRLETSPGDLEIVFAYQPLVSNINSTIDFNNFKLSERVLSYGVVAEYCYIGGRYDDATIWDNRFKTSLININRPRRELKIKKRLWI